VAYAAHELRGEIAVQLAVAEGTLADPDAGVVALREMGEGVVAACSRQQRLLEGLLALARSQYGQLRREPVDLAATAARVVGGQDLGGLGCAAVFESARTVGDGQLVERLVANLVANAARHNVSGGWLEVATSTAAGRAAFTIVNSGPVIPAGEVGRLFRPFQRLGSDAGPVGDGVGLGLAIVQAIADAHDATLIAQARPGGGLRIAVDFPVVAR
jgi:signal transduction histidine kinase